MKYSSDFECSSVVKSKRDAHICRRHGRTSSSGCYKSAPEIDWLPSRPVKGRINGYDDQEFQIISDTSHFFFGMISQLDLHIIKSNPNKSNSINNFQLWCTPVLVDTRLLSWRRLFFILGYARWPPDPSPVSRVKAPVEGQCSVWCSPTTTVGILGNLKFQLRKANAFGMTLNEDAEKVLSKVNCCSIFQCEEQIVGFCTAGIIRLFLQSWQVQLCHKGSSRPWTARGVAGGEQKCGAQGSEIEDQDIN